MNRVTIPFLGQVELGEMLSDLVEGAAQNEIAAQFRQHQGENRRARRAAVANFDVAGEKGLRRKLWKQRKRARTPKMKG